MGEAPGREREKAAGSKGRPSHAHKKGGNFDRASPVEVVEMVVVDNQGE